MTCHETKFSSHRRGVLVIVRQERQRVSEPYHVHVCPKDFEALIHDPKEDIRAHVSLALENLVPPPTSLDRMLPFLRNRADRNIGRASWEREVIGGEERGERPS